jgi:ssDNA-binding Zn-finger/Zn-ribbon topoisomerase 1
MVDSKTLSFMVKNDANEPTAPRWKEVEVENANCPRCGQTMLVILGAKGILYAYCFECKKYHLAD